MIEKELVDILLADSTVSGLVGTRIFPVVVRSDTQLPAITYMRMSSERTYTFGGCGGYAKVRVGMTAWGKEYAQVRSVADAVRVALDAYTGDGSGTLELSMVNDGTDSYDPDIDVFGCSLDIEVQFQEV